MQEEWKDSTEVAASSRWMIEEEDMALLTPRAAGILIKDCHAWHICKFFPRHPSAQGFIEKSMFKDASLMGFSNSLRVIEMDVLAGGNSSHPQAAS